MLESLDDRFGMHRSVAILIQRLFVADKNGSVQGDEF